MKNNQLVTTNRFCELNNIIYSQWPNWSKSIFEYSILLLIAFIYSSYYVYMEKIYASFLHNYVPSE